MKRCRPGLGTYVEITVAQEAPPGAIDAAYAAIAEVERLMSFHDRGSELSALNALKRDEAMTLSPWTWDVLALAQALHAATGGSFDCGVGAQLVRSGLLPAHGRGLPDPASITDLALLPDHRVRVRRPVCLDLGGIAKGFAVDKAIEVLAGAGVASAVVNAGGDLRVLGETPHPIHLRDTIDPARLRHLGDLADGAIATSAGWAPPEEDGPLRAPGALMDPRSGAPVPGGRCYTVLAPTCAVADGLTKALAVDGRLADDCLARYGAMAWVQ